MKQHYRFENPNCTEEDPKNGVYRTIGVIEVSEQMARIKAKRKNDSESGLSRDEFPMVKVFTLGAAWNR